MALTQIDDRGLKTPIDLIDNEKIRFGTGNDLELYHDGSNSFIQRVTGGTGNLYIRAFDSANLVFESGNGSTGSENAIVCNGNGDVELYHSGTKRFETSATGVTIPNTLTVSDGANIDGDIKFKGSGDGDDFFWDKSANQLTLTDSRKIRFGDSGDLEIYHDGTHTYIDNATGLLSLRNGGAAGNKIYIQPKQGEYSINALPDGAVELYYDNVKTCLTTANGLKVQGPEGGDGIIQIYADEGDDNADCWRLHSEADSSTFSIQNANNGSTWETNIECNGDGNVELYNDGTKQLLTTSDGIEIKPDVEGSNAVLYLTADQGDDNLDKWAIKAASDGTIYHQSYTSGSFVTKFETRAGGDIKVNNGNILMGTAGTGINFSATSDGSGGSNVNEVLDDYEEGDFAAYIGGQTNKDTYNQAGNGQYTKIGRLVYVHGYFAGIDIDDNAAGQVMIYGLPFTPTHRSYGGSATADVHISKVNFNTSRKQCWNISTNGLAGYESRADDTHIDWPVTDFNRASTFIWFSAVYITTT